MQDREHPLRGEETVRHHPHEERRDHRRDRRGPVRESDLRPGELEGLPRYVPIVTYHAPHTKYSRNMRADSLTRTLVVTAVVTA